MVCTGVVYIEHICTGRLFYFSNKLYICRNFEWPHVHVYNIEMHRMLAIYTQGKCYVAKTIGCGSYLHKYRQTQNMYSVAIMFQCFIQYLNSDDIAIAQDVGVHSYSFLKLTITFKLLMSLI